MTSAHGVRSLQTPSTYIICIIAALVLYYIDRRYQIRSLIDGTKKSANDIGETISSLGKVDEEPDQAQGILLLAILILTSVLALKRVQNKRQNGLF